METDETFEVFKEIWNESSREQRMEFLRTYAPHLDKISMETYARRTTEKLKPGVLFGLVELFEKAQRPTEDES